MPAPKNPNTSAATEASVAARARAKHNKWAAEMRAAGWIVEPPGRNGSTIEACDGLTEAQVDHFVQAPCGRRDTHSAH